MNISNINNNNFQNLQSINQTKRPVIYDEFINSNNILSLENFEDNHENYVLKAPRRGKIIRGPVCTAYKRQNLGSIPRKTEKILIDEIKSANTNKGFSTQSARFANSYNKNDSMKHQFPGPGAYKTQKQFDHVVIDASHHSSKGFGNGFASSTSRFEDCKEFYDKFLPGPGSYKSDQSTSMISTMSKTLSYKSLYNTTSAKPLKEKAQNPGPGTYNPILINKKSEFAEGENHYFKSENDRFRKVPKSALGPGKYFRNDIDFAITKSPYKGKTYINNAYNAELNGDFNSGNGNKTSSYFFKKPEDKAEKGVGEFITTNNPINNRKKQTPGPGAYEIKKDNYFNWNFTIQEKKESLYIETLKLNKYKKRLQTAGNIKPKPLLEMNLTQLETLKKINEEKITSPQKKEVNSNTNRKNMFVSTNGFNKGNFNNKNLDAWADNEESGFEINMIEKASSPIRYPDFLIKRNIPGPAYYNPIKKPVKVNFNWNLEKKWI